MISRGPGDTGPRFGSQMKGQIERRAMELGGFPMRVLEQVQEEIRDTCALPLELLQIPGLPKTISETRLVQAMRKIDPDLAHMIESLAPVYLVKK